MEISTPKPAENEVNEPAAQAHYQRGISGESMFLSSVHQPSNESMSELDDQKDENSYKKEGLKSSVAADARTMHTMHVSAGAEVQEAPGLSRRGTVMSALAGDPNNYFKKYLNAGDFIEI